MSWLGKTPDFTMLSGGNRGDRRIERLLRMSHVLVISWVKKSAKQIKEKSKKRPTKIDTLELVELCVKKTSGC